MDLDQQFGPALPPQGYGGRPAVSPWESLHSPRSLTRLSLVTAAPLSELMQSVRNGWALGQIWVNDTLIIWLVDRSGFVWFAVEELVLNGEPVSVPKHQTMALTRHAPKLGYPSLVGGQNARIGGEIYFDPTLTPPDWVINNRSGRYGLHPSRTAVQLQQAATAFGAHGISLVVDFI